MGKPKLSVVVPIFNEQECIHELVRRFRRVFESDKQFDYRVILVDDGSRDESVNRVLEMTDGDSRFELVRLTRNFGHQIAVTAGLDQVNEGYAAIIDADLQDPPELLPVMLSELQARKVHIVYGKRRFRNGETKFKTVSAKAFYRIMRMLSRIEIPVDAGDFRVMDQTALLAIRGLRERNRFLRGLLPWTGLRSHPFEYEREERFAGESKYGLGKMFRLAGDAVVAFSAAPLRAIQFAGFFIFCLSIGVLTTLLLLYSIRIPTQWLVICMTLFIGGLNLSAVGIIAGYVHRIQDEVRGRPLYFIETEVLNGVEGNQG